MTTLTTLRILAALSIWFLMSGCDPGSKQAFADSIRTAGHFEKKQ